MAIDTPQVLPTSAQGAVYSQSWLESIEVNVKYHIFPYLLSSFRQYFIGKSARGCTCDSHSGRVMGCILGHLVCS